MSRFTSAVVSTAPSRTPHAVVLTGRPGIGKTFFASTIPRSFFIPVEHGLKGASRDHNPSRFVDEHERDILPRTIGELRDAIDAFKAKARAEKAYRHLVLDSISGIEALVNKAACGSERVAHMDAKDFKSVWTAAIPLWSDVQAQLDAVRAMGIHVWLIAHSAEAQEAAADGTLFHKWDLQFQGSGKSLVNLRALWRSWADHVLFLDWDAQVKAGKTMTSRAVGIYRSRILITRETPAHFAKNRAGLPPVLPATWTDLEAALRAGVPADDSRTRRAIEALLPRLSAEHRAIAVADLANANTPTALSAALSRAQGMLSVEREDDDELDAAPSKAKAEPEHVDLGRDDAPTEAPPAAEHVDDGSVPVDQEPAWLPGDDEEPVSADVAIEGVDAPLDDPEPEPPPPPPEPEKPKSKAASKSAKAPPSGPRTIEDALGELDKMRARNASDEELAALHTHAIALTASPRALQSWTKEIREDLDAHRLSKSAFETLIRPVYNARKASLEASGEKGRAA